MDCAIFCSLDKEVTDLRVSWTGRRKNPVWEESVEEFWTRKEKAIIYQCLDFPPLLRIDWLNRTSYQPSQRYARKELFFPSSRGCQSNLNRYFKVHLCKLGLLDGL